MIAAMYARPEQAVAASRGRPSGRGGRRAPSGDPAEVQHAVHRSGWRSPAPTRRRSGTASVKRPRAGVRAGVRVAQVLRAAGRAASAPATPRPASAAGPSRAARRASSAARTARARRRELRAASQRGDQPHEPREVVRRRPASAAPTHPRPGSRGASSWIRQGREVCAVLGSRIVRSIHTVVYGWTIAACQSGDRRPDPHPAQQLDRRRPARPRRRRPGRRPDRAARQGARRHPRRLLLALRRPPRAAGRDARHLGAPEHSTRCSSASSARAATPAAKVRRAGMLTLLARAAADRPRRPRLGAARRGASPNACAASTTAGWSTCGR